MARSFASAGFHAMVLEFAGQHGVPGQYSVAKSCAAALRFAQTLEGPVLYFGICSGAIASLAASSRTKEPAGVFCWDMAARYDYSVCAVQRISEGYGVNFCPQTSLAEVQAADYLAAANAPITLAFPIRSPQTNGRAQAGLASLARDAEVQQIAGLGHFPGVPRRSERLFSEILLKWAESRILALSSSTLYANHRA
jgi:hypothetical protein